MENLTPVPDGLLVERSDREPRYIPQLNRAYAQ